jgi:inhibitor of KinA
MPQSFSIFPLGESALVIDFGDKIDVEINKKVGRLFKRLKSIEEPIIIDLVPAYSSLAVYFNLYVLQQEKLRDESSFDLMSDFIESLAMEDEEVHEEKTTLIEIPVCYNCMYGSDLALSAHHKDLSIEKFIEIHTSVVYRVYMIGFLPGFPYMGETDERIALPRKTIPRKDVPAGSVGIAGRQTGIYPLTSPGGWQIIGRTPVSMFNKNNKRPVLLQPGDEVKFYSITEHEFANYQGGNS